MEREGNREGEIERDGLALLLCLRTGMTDGEVGSITRLKTRVML